MFTVGARLEAPRWCGVCEWGGERGGMRVVTRWLRAVLRRAADVVRQPPMQGITTGKDGKPASEMFMPVRAALAVPAWCAASAMRLSPGAGPTASTESPWRTRASRRLAGAWRLLCGALLLRARQYPLALLILHAPTHPWSWIGIAGWDAHAEHCRALRTRRAGSTGST